jgi:hypothetical protein
MDEILRILRRAAVEDPSAKDRYIHALERVLCERIAPSLSSYSLVDLMLDISNLSLYVGNYIEKHGRRVSTSLGDTVIWMDSSRDDRETTFYREGLALGLSPQGVAAGLVATFNDEFKKWSAKPVLFYDEVSHPHNYELLNRYIYTWEITY